MEHLVLSARGCYEYICQNCNPRSSPLWTASTARQAWHVWLLSTRTLISGETRLPRVSTVQNGTTIRHSGSKTAMKANFEMKEILKICCRGRVLQEQYTLSRQSGTRVIASRCGSTINMRSGHTPPDKWWRHFLVRDCAFSHKIWLPWLSAFERTVSPFGMNHVCVQTSSRE